MILALAHPTPSHFRAARCPINSFNSSPGLRVCAAREAHERIRSTNARGLPHMTCVMPRSITLLAQCDGQAQGTGACPAVCVKSGKCLAVLLFCIWVGQNRSHKKLLIFGLNFRLFGDLNLFRMEKWSYGATNSGCHFRNC